MIGKQGKVSPMFVVFTSIALAIARRPVLSSASDTRYCKACSVLAAHLESAVYTEESADVLLRGARELCGKFDSTMSSPCHQIASLALDSLVHFMRLGLSPSEACSATQLCPRSRRPNPSLVRRPHIQRTPGKGSDICVKAVTEVARLAEQNLPVAQIKEQLDSFSETLPYPDSALSSSIVDLDLTEILAELSKATEPLSICALLGFSSLSNRKFSCGECVQVTSFAREFALSGFDKEAIVGRVVDVCQTLPGQLSSSCTEFCYQHLPQVLDSVDRLVPPSEICEVQKFCPDSKPRRALKIVKDGFFCTLCTDLVDAAAEALVDHKVEEEIEQLLEEQCAKLPSVIGVLCRSIVAQYLPVILQWIEEGIETLEICVRIGLCDGAAQQGFARIARFVK
jgi:saposin